MGRKIFVWFLVIFFLTSAPRALAQQGTKIFRIGYLTNASLSANAARHETFRQALRDLG